MATYTNLGIKKIATGDEAGTWGDSTNTNFDYFDTSIVGYVAVTLSATGSSGTPNTINVADFSASNGRNRIVEFVDAADLGGTVYVQVTPNDFAGYYFIRNSLSNNRNILFFQGTYDVARAYEIPNATDVVIRCTGSGATSYIYSILDDLSINSATVTDIYADTTTTTILNTVNAQISGGNIDGADLGAGSPILTAAIDSAQITTAVISNLTAYGAIISVTDNVNAALRVTQLGTANALEIEDSTNPDVTPFIVNSSGTLIQGYTTAVASKILTTAATPAWQAHGVQIGTFSWTNNATFPGFFVFNKSKSGTVGTLSAVTDGDSLGVIQFNGADNDATSTFNPAAYISAQVAGAVASTSIPGRLNFATTTVGGTFAGVKVSISPEGYVGIGATPTSAAQLLDIRANNNTLTSDPLNILRFTDTDATTAADQPIGKIEFYNSDTGNAAVGAYILASAAGVSGGGKLRLGAAANAGAASDMVTISSNKVEMVGETTSNSFQALGSVYSTTANGWSAFYDQRTYAGAANLSYTTTLFVNDIAVSGSGQIIDQYGVYIEGLQSGTGKNYGVYSSLSASGTSRYNFYAYGNAPNYFEGNVEVGSGSILVKGTGAIGYGTGSGGTVTQVTSRTTGVTLNNTNGSITLVSAAGTATWQSFTVTNSTVAISDVVVLSQRSGTDLYMLEVTRVAAGSFRISFATTGGTTTEQPVFNFAVIKAVTA